MIDLLVKLYVSRYFWVLAAFVETTIGKIFLSTASIVAIFCLFFFFFQPFIILLAGVVLIASVVSSQLYGIFSDGRAFQKVTSIEYQEHANVLPWYDSNDALFGYRIDLEKNCYFLVLRLQRPRSYSFLGSERIPASAKVVLLEFVEDELDALWAFRDFGWTHLG